MEKNISNDFNRKEEITKKLYELAEFDWTVLLNLYQEINYIDKSVFKFSNVNYLLDILHYSDNIDIDKFIKKVAYGNINNTRDLVRINRYGYDCYENVTDEELERECKDNTSIWALIGWLDNHRTEEVQKILIQYGLDDCFKDK